MTLSSQRLLPQHSLCFTRTTIAPATFFRTPNRIPNLNSFGLHSFGSSTTRNYNPFHFNAIKSEGDTDMQQKRVFRSYLNFDSLLSAMELSCLISSAIVSVVLAGNGSKNWLLNVSGNNRVSVVWGVLTLVSGVVVGAWIRWRQWRRISTVRVKGGLVERIENLEEELRKTVRVLRVLSRHAEKLWKRIRATRYAMKDPITQSAALAQKNSEATRALAMQSEILEKELREIQKVLLAMQEQQQKQLDLILSLGKPLKPWENQFQTRKEQDTIETTNSAEDEVKHVEDHQI